MKKIFILLLLTAFSRTVLAADGIIRKGEATKNVAKGAVTNWVFIYQFSYGGKTVNTPVAIDASLLSNVLDSGEAAAAADASAKLLYKEFTEGIDARPDPTPEKVAVPSISVTPLP